MKNECVLFICTHNSARSQMAEGLLRHKYGDRYRSFSAGISPTSVNPFAVKVMAEIGIDISSHRSKSVYDFLKCEIDHVVTVCDSAKENCPFFPGAKNYHHESFENPVACQGAEEEILNCFREVRNAIKHWIEEKFS